MFEKIKPSTFILILLIIGLLVHGNILFHDMFWDDDDFILKNRFIQDWQYWPHFFTDNLIAGNHLVSNYWRPLLQTVFSLQWHWWADWTPGWHGVSLLLHTADAVLLFLLFRGISRQQTGPFIAAVIFLIHPVQTETVAYANSLGDSLAFLFILVGLNAFVLFRTSGKRAHYLSALTCFPLALMSKEIGIIMLGLLPLCEIFYKNPGHTAFHDTRSPGEIQYVPALLSRFVEYMPFLGVALIYAGLRATVLHFSDTTNYYPERPDFQSHVLVRVFTFLKALPEYINLVLWPAHLQFDRPFTMATLRLSPMIFLGATLLSAAGALVWKCRRSVPMASLGMAWFLIALVPYSNIPMVINGLFYEHFLYIPMAGAGLLLGAAVDLWTKKEGHLAFHPGFRCEMPGVPFFLLTIIFIALGTRTILRNNDWRSAIVFYEKTAAGAANSYRVFNNLGMAYADKGMLDKAERAYKKATTLDPANAVAFHNLGNLARARGRDQEAAAFFEHAIGLQRNFIFSYMALAQLYLAHGDVTHARQVLESSLPYGDDQALRLRALMTLAGKQQDAAGVRRYQSMLNR